MLKRILGLALSAILALGLLPTVRAQEGENICGTDEEATVTFIAGTVGSEHEVAVTLGNNFMEVCPNITVNVVERPTSTTETLAQYQQFFEAQSGELDVFQIDVAWPGLVAEHVLDMNEYLDEEFLSQFYPGVLAGYTVQGRLAAVPWFAGAGMLYYRTDLLEKYGLEVPQTWDELYTAAKTIQDGERETNPDFWGFVFQGHAYEGLTCDALEWQASYDGGVIITPDGVVDVNNPNAIEIFDKVASWVGDIVPEAVLTFQEEDARAVWQAGNAAFMRNWGYAYTLGQADDSVIKDKFDVGPLPGKEPGMSAATLGGWGLSVSKYSDNVDAAVAFVKWVTSIDQQVWFTLQRSEQPVQPAVYDAPEIQEQLPFILAFKDVLNFATPRPTAVAGEQYARVSELYYTAVHDVLAGSKDAATAMADLELALADLGFELP